MRAWPAVLAVLCLPACSEPPLRELAAAEARLAEAREAGAARFAPERLKEAEAALQIARQKIDAKDYRGALSAAGDAADKSKGAAQAARAAARTAAETAQAQALAVLDELKTLREDATKAKVPDKVFESLQATVDAARESLAGAASAMDRGDFIEADKTASDVKAKAAPLPRQFRDAMDKWLAAHGRRPAPRKP